MRERGPPDDRDPETLLEFGVVNLDKPPGPSAHQVAAWVRDAADVARAAHAGTLDPKVTGCLPILTGTATRAAQVFDESRKGYVSELELHAPAPNDLAETLAEFEGPLYQKPPRKSAVARRLRVREIFSLEALEVEDRRALIDVECESGTYVRKLCHDLGLALGTGANMGDLRRTKTGTFDDASLVTLHDLVDGLAFWREDGDADLLREVVQPAERALEHLPGLTVAPSAAREIAEGAPVYPPGILETDLGAADEGDLVASYTPDGAAVCLGHLVGDPAADSGVVVELERVLV
ncbi:RNA-guided pseudouridylation complex pseudouridine synthase subunit Cbf5 [Natronomonas salina]|uniref:RNA-guided pseudouridylation complex pseudouridine synthase subunit Cbf5 n=1 Tax=Natronomonas salina TaxID=1710540 RepID=UPI0015B6389E|nr:RNA-guided pseudouridylation complex pseudouridine synthase subunit Cbf5 [Natronomonas salina]QLD91287.1 RNA-guided pseudouridylation complex pseudouridine synthase subunit Cbf5 [Natronomonas salina]